MRTEKITVNVGRWWRPRTMVAWTGHYRDQNKVFVFWYDHRAPISDIVALLKEIETETEGVARYVELDVYSDDLRNALQSAGYFTYSDNRMRKDVSGLKLAA